MASLEDLLISVSGRIVNEKDFVFSNKKGELAQNIRAEFSQKIRQRWGVENLAVSIDEDGHVQLETEKGNILIMPRSMVFVQFLASAGSVANGQEIVALADLLEELFKIRRPLRATEYAMSFYRPIHFREAVVFEKINPLFFGTVTDKLSQHFVAANAKKYRSLLSYREGGFSDQVEIDVKPNEFDVWYSRAANATRYPSFAAFVKAADLGAILERVMLFLEPFIADPTKIKGPLYQERSKD